MADFNIEISGLPSVYRYDLLILLCELFADRRRVIRFSNASYPLVYTHLNDSLYTISSIKASGIILLLRFISIISIVTIAFTLSVLCKSQALSLCLSILLLFAGSILGGTDLLAQFTWYKFTLFPHLNLVAYVNKSAGDAISTLNIPYSMTVIAIYFLICLLISFSVFQKRDITA